MKRINMPASRHREVDWDDIGLTLVIGAILLPFGAVEEAGRGLDRFAKQEAKPSLFSFITRPLKAAAAIFGSAAEKVANVPDGMIWPGVIAAAAPALYAGYAAGAALGFSFPALFAGGHFLATGGAAAAALGAAAIAFPLALTALAVTAAIGLGLGRCLLRAPEIGAALVRGAKETQWRPGREAAAAVASAPEAAPESTKASALMLNFNAVAEKMSEAGPEQRIAYLAWLRKTYPTDFADAAGSDRHAPQLRKKITVGKPLQLRKKPRRAKWHGLGTPL